VQLLLYVNLCAVNLTFKGIMLLTQSNNWEKSDIFINCTHTLHCTTGRLESNSSNESATARFSALSYNHGSYSTTVSATVGLYESCYKIWVTLRSERCNSLTPSFRLNENHSVTARAGLWVGREGPLSQALTSRGRQKGGHRPATR
jgi:hypothetical protein